MPTPKVARSPKPLQKAFVERPFSLLVSTHAVSDTLPRSPWLEDAMASQTSHRRLLTRGLQASQSPAQLIFTGRSKARIQEAIDALNAEFPSVRCQGLELDLSSQKAVREAASELMSWDSVPSIDIVINSAGVMGIQERTLTSDGIELHFATNHVGHWLFCCLILPKLIKAAAEQGKPKGSVRIVNISAGSPMVSAMRWSDVNFDKKNRTLPESEQPNVQIMEAWGYKDSLDCTYLPLDGYNRAKVANVLFGIGANKRLFDKYGILTLAVHPGVISTELGRNFPTNTLDAVKDMLSKGIFAYKSFKAGSSTAMVAALDPKMAENVGETKEGTENYGALLDDCQVSTKAHPLAVASTEAERLWQLSETLTKQQFAW